MFHVYYITAIYIYKECGSLRSPTPCLCMHFICLYTAWKVIAVLLYSMSKLNNNGSKARYSNRPSLIINHVFDVIDDLVPTSAIFSISLPKNSLTAEPFLTCNDGKEEATERIFSLHYAFMCRSGTQVELPRRLAMSQVGLVDDHTLHQPCVQSLSFKPRLALWMPAHWAPFLWPTVAIPQRKK